MRFWSNTNIKHFHSKTFILQVCYFTVLSILSANVFSFVILSKFWLSHSHSAMSQISSRLPEALLAADVLAACVLCGLNSRVSENSFHLLAYSISTNFSERSLIASEHSEPLKFCVLVKYSFNVDTTHRVLSSKALSLTSRLLTPGLLCFRCPSSWKV